MMLDRARLLEDLNPSQREAVVAPDGPVLVLAGAGSGKTRVIAHRIADIIGVRGVSPKNVLAVTFTNKAAGEMARRVEALLSPAGLGAPWVGTFHATCVRMLRQHIVHLGRSRDFVIYDEDDRLSLIKRVLRDEAGVDRSLTPSTFAHRISYAKNQMLTVGDLERQARGPRETRIAQVYRLYQERLDAAGAVDFDDLLLLTVRLLEEAPNVLAWYRGLWKHVLVDEYQDTNRAQYRIIRQLTSEHRNICVVGDPDQCLVEGTLIETPQGPRAIQNIREGDRVMAGAGWGSIRGGRVEEVRRSKFDGEIIVVKTADGRGVRATPNHMMFARIDPAVGCHYVFLMYKRRLDYRIGVTRGVRSGDQRAVVTGLQMRTNGEVADRLRALASCGSRRVLNFTMFGDPRPHVWHEHRIQVVSSDRETSRNNYDKGLEFARSLADAGDLEVVRRARLTVGRSFQFMPASHVRPGMITPVSVDGEVKEVRVATVERQPYHGFVYDLAVEDFRNYVAGGLVVHNSVYKWRGADVRNILDFENDYPGARVSRLEQNYRSTKRILAIAADVIAHNVARKDKTLWTENAEGERARLYRAWDEHEEANWVAQSVLGLREQGTTWDETALFYRTNAQSRVLEDALRRARVPYVIVGGVRFYERKEVKDVLAYVRLAVNPGDDVAFNRAVQAPPRGIGKTSLARLADVATREGKPLLGLAATPPDDVRGAARKGLEQFATLVARLARERTILTPPAFLDLVINESGYREALKAERSPEAEARLENLEELVAAAEDYTHGDPEPSIAGFLDGVALVSDIDELEAGTPRVTLMTLHSAKGLEFEHVFLTGMEEGVFPHLRSMNDGEDIEEERRLCYVGVTRAKRRLFLSYALHRRIHGYGIGEPSRFLREMPEKHLDPVNASRAPSRTAEAFGGAASDFTVEPHDDDLPLKVGARVRHARWGEGLVVGVVREGDDTIVTVGFASVGRKRLSLQYAHLEEL